MRHVWDKSVGLVWQWLKKVEVSLALTLLVLVVAGYGFVELADDVQEGDTHRMDNAVLKFFRESEDPSKTIGPQSLADAAQDITALGGVTVLGMVVAGVMGHFMLRGRRGDALLVGVASLGALLANAGLKSFFARERPTVVPSLDTVHTYSFPSGHAMLSAAVYLTLGILLARAAESRRAKFYYVAVAVVLTLLIGTSRVFLGVHFPSDVLAGWTAGLMWALACRAVAALIVGRRARRSRGQAEAGEGAEPDVAEGVKGVVAAAAQ